MTFHNEENGFCVLRLKARDQCNLVTVVGHAAIISAGEWVQTAGTWTNDPTHALKFRANFLKAITPTTLDGVAYGRHTTRDRFAVEWEAVHN